MNEIFDFIEEAADLGESVMIQSVEGATMTYYGGARMLWPYSAWLASCSGRGRSARFQVTYPDNLSTVGQSVSG